MPADQSLVYYWASIGFSAAGVLLFLWLLKDPGIQSKPGRKPGNGAERSAGARRPRYSAVNSIGNRAEEPPPIPADPDH